MRLNEEINEIEFKEYRSEYQERLDRTESLISDVNQTASAWLELAEGFFSNLVALRDTYDLAEDDEKRRMLQFLGSNWVLQSKKVAFSPRKPYDLLLNVDENKNWRARPDSNRRSPP